MRAINDCTDLNDIAFVNQTICDRVLGFPDADRLRNLVSKDSGTRQQSGLDLLFAFCIGTHAGDMRARAYMRIH